MPLSRTQRWILHRYQTYADGPPRLALILRAQAPRFALLAGVGAAGYALPDPVVGAFVSGFALGVMVRQLAHLRMALQGAPLLARVVDQDRVARMLAEDRAT